MSHKKGPTRDTSTSGHITKHQEVSWNRQHIRCTAISGSVSGDVATCLLKALNPNVNVIMFDRPSTDNQTGARTSPSCTKPLLNALVWAFSCNYRVILGLGDSTTKVDFWNFQNQNTLSEAAQAHNHRDCHESFRLRDSCNHDRTITKKNKFPSGFIYSVGLLAGMVHVDIA